MQAPPRQVFVFSGHMPDAPTRAQPRFPPQAEADAASRIEQVLDAHAAGPQDLALTQGAAGGDLIFAEACLARGLALELLLPLDEPEFMRQSILPAADSARWQQRYEAVRLHLRCPPRLMEAELGPASGADGAPAHVFERCNNWLIDEAFARGARQVQFICLWNGGGGDGPGGTAHMVAEVRRRGGLVSWIDTRTLRGSG